MSHLLKGMRSRGQTSVQAQQRLLRVLHGQLLGMEGRLKEERRARMTTLAELINTLDEEAAADIRKVAMRVIQGAIADIKAIQPSAAQAVLSLLPPGAKQPVLQVEPDPGPGKTSAQGAGGVLQGQERLQQEGKAALHTLICTRETLQEAMENELQNQKEIRTHWRNFFSVMEKVMEEMQKEREEYLHSQADVLAVQMATISYQKAEKWTKILEMSRATVTLQSLLIQQLRETKNLEVNKMAQSIHRCRSGLEEAEQLQMKRSMLDSPQMSQLGEHPASASAEQEPSRCAADENSLLPVKLRENVVHRNILSMPDGAVETERSLRLQEKRQSLVEKLLPRSRLLLPRDAGAGEGGKQDGFTKAKQPELVKRLLSDTVREETHDPADENTTSHSAFGERLFVFRDPPESRDSENVPRRKKRNFLNLKKGSVAPAT
uniref:Ellis van Creveld syndrome 2 n=1 Tax=Nothobranchius pienaari TaxID=704102 RepID=A0A1A8NB02_9TELE